MNQRPSGYEPDELPTAPPRDKMVEGVEESNLQPTVYKTVALPVELCQRASVTISIIHETDSFVNCFFMLFS